MIDADRITAEAFRLFEQEKYSACLDLIQSIPPRSIDTRIRILEAICLYSVGSLDEAEVCLRDLRSKVPDSSEVCLYLGKVLERKGDEGARAEFAEAVRLAPDQTEGIRRYARYLTGAGDHRAALCLLKRLVLLTGKGEDIAGLMLCYSALGFFEEGIARYKKAGAPDECFRIYLNLLLASEKFQELADEIEKSPNKDDHDLIILSCESLVHINSDKADQEFLIQLRKNPSAELASHYARYLESQGLIREALGVWSTWLAKSENPAYQLQGASLIETVSGPEQALELYSQVLFGKDIHEHLNLNIWLSSFRRLLVETRGSTVALDEALTRIRPDLQPSILVGIAEWCEEERRHEDAKRLFLQAFRSDLTNSGFSYAQYLGRNSEKREQKKILGYILKTIRKARDLEMIAGKILTLPEPEPDLISFLNQRFEGYVSLLSQEGRELYARCLSMETKHELQAGSPDKALKHALTGLSVVPVDASSVAELLFALLVESKTQVLPDFLPSQICPVTKPPGSVSTTGQISFSWLDPGEGAVVEYLRKHRVCNEMDLRKVAGTRRVAGLMNRIMRKSEEHGIHLADKEGCSEFGEVYRYAGP
ncbi:tetratricopeptide repeat protein [Methanospirillum lacunae]|uniref:Tetratricopeptide repeat protein n=1 Tax=Methanospirillum lacunae TaxID=668570 RepID=A0A2V2MQK7_9EURY|nr:hypothetical protein [Methanospirillum lacunae]PWR70524.1 hypothetical protein DK846_14110 [Methanospirillum lacunae]